MTRYLGLLCVCVYIYIYIYKRKQLNKKCRAWLGCNWKWNELNEVSFTCFPTIFNQLQERLNSLPSLTFPTFFSFLSIKHKHIGLLSILQSTFRSGPFIFCCSIKYKILFRNYIYIYIYITQTYCSSSNQPYCLHQGMVFLLLS